MSCCERGHGRDSQAAPGAWSGSDTTGAQHHGITLGLAADNGHYALAETLWDAMDLDRITLGDPTDMTTAATLKLSIYTEAVCCAEYIVTVGPLSNISLCAKYLVFIYHPFALTLLYPVYPVYSISINLPQSRHLEFPALFHSSRLPILLNIH